MKLKYIIILIIAVLVLIPIVFLISLNISNELNPPYILLENGERGYYMATGNVLLSGLLSIIIPLFLVLLVIKKLRKQKHNTT